MTSIELTGTGRRLLELRYLEQRRDGSYEEPEALFRRVARAIAACEPAGLRQRCEERFATLMLERRFLPNAPTLLGAGRALGQLHACFVLPVHDSITGVFATLTKAAVVHAKGGGTGFSFSSLRSRGEPIRTGGTALGPVPFLAVFDAETEVLKHGGTGWGANMGVLRIDHPDIVEFVQAKATGKLRNFNLSVGVTDAFMGALAGASEWRLVDPHSGREVGMPVQDLWSELCQQAWATGDPGLVFLDRIEADNPTPSLGRIEATNPCGEAPLLPYEACCLGGINVARFVNSTATDVDWTALADVAADAVRMLDDVLEVARYPLPEIADATLRTRKLGIGVMGFADLLVQLGIPYDDAAAEQLARRLMRAIRMATTEASTALADERGPFPAFEASSIAAAGGRPVRNATTTSNAPNSTIGPIAGCSPGIEPLFAISFERHLRNGDRIAELHRGFVDRAKQGGFASEDLFANVQSSGTLAGVRGVPDDVRRVFVTAREIAPAWHVRIQAAFQESTELGVSKTINLPKEAAPGDVDRVFRLAHETGCKGITVYRDGCGDTQFLVTGGEGPCDRESSSCPA